MLQRSIIDPDTGREQLVSAIGLGCSKIGSFGGLSEPAKIDALLSHAVGRGVALVDTADIYGQGDSERAIGRFLRKHPGALFVVTKAGKRFSLKMRLLRPLKPFLMPLLRSRGSKVTGQRAANISHDFSPAWIRRAAKRSRARLGVARIDALLLHSPTAAEVRHPGLSDALQGLKASGVVGVYGVSVDDHATIAAAIECIAGISLLQLTPAVFEEAVASGLKAKLDALGVALILREAISLRPAGTGAAEAIRTAVASETYATVLVGTTSLSHLDEAIEAAS